MEEFSDSDFGSIPSNSEYIHFNRTLRALFKKSLLIKIRKPMAIVEFIIALVLWVVLYPCWKIAYRDTSGNQYPYCTYTSVIPSPLATLFISNLDYSFVMGPDCNNTRELIDLMNQSMILSLAIMLNANNNGADPPNTTNITDINNTSAYNFKRLHLMSHSDIDMDQILNGIGPKMKSFVNEYSRNIIHDINEEFSSFKKINLENSELEDFIKLAAIEGIINYYNNNNNNGINDFDFDDFINQRITEYINSLVTRENILKLKLRIIDEDEITDDVSDFDIENSIFDSNFRDYTKHFNSKIQAILNSTTIQITQSKPKQKNIFSKIINIFNVRENKASFHFPFPISDQDLIEIMFPGQSFSPDIFDMNASYHLIEGIYNFDPVIVDSAKEIQSEIYDHTDVGIGIFWKNAMNETGATKNPVVQSYYQSYSGNPSDEVFELVIRLISYMNDPEGIQVDYAYDLLQEYSHTNGKKMYDISILVGIIVIFPAVIATMSDLQLLLEEKDNHVMVLSFLMGCSETAYFLVITIMQFISSLPAYVLMCVFYCYVFVFKGTSFTLMLVISVLFILAHIAFLMFLTTFMKKAAMGRIITVLFIVISIFFAFVHFFYTLDENNDSNVAKHIFSVIPLSCYEMAMISMYKSCRASLPPVDWHQLKNNPMVHLPYQMWYALMWLPIDFVFYTLLFLLFNLTNSRNFGSPPIKWKELFKKKAWKRMLRKRKTLGLSKKGTSVLYDTNTQLFDAQLLKVENLSKVYHGHKTVTALSDVNFSINQNEVIIVIGPNGAGKSTLINIVCGALQPTTGTLKLYNDPPTENFNVIQDILGVCFQDNVIVEKLSIEENFELFGAFRDIPNDELHRTMNFYAETLQLKEMMKTRTGDLSGGQKRKVCISLSLLGNPPLVIMDEPTAGVDVQARQLIWKVIASLKNTTTIITSHALEEAEAVSTRLFVVAGGTLPFAGTATEFRNTFKCGYILRVEGCDIQDKNTVVAIHPDQNSNSNSNVNTFTIEQGVSAQPDTFVTPTNGIIRIDDNENKNINDKPKKKVKIDIESNDNDNENDNNNNNENNNLAGNRNSSRVVFITDENNEVSDPVVKMSEITKPKPRPKFSRARRRRKDDDESSNENKIFESRYYAYSSSSDNDENIFDVNQNEFSYSEMAANRVLKMIKKVEPKAKISRERVDAIRLPVSKNVPRIMSEIEAHKAELGVVSYSISVEQLEDVLLKMIMTEEASFNRTND